MYKKSRCLCIGIFLWVRQAWRVARNQRAYKRVVSDEGTPGTDGMTVDQLADYLKQYWPILKTRLLAGEYHPQGGPLSPLLSNIQLNELDREWERRSHRFVRYARTQNFHTPRWCERTADVNPPHTRLQVSTSVGLSHKRPLSASYAPGIYCPASLMNASRHP